MSKYVKPIFVSHPRFLFFPRALRFFISDSPHSRIVSSLMLLFIVENSFSRSLFLFFYFSDFSRKYVYLCHLFWQFSHEARRTTLPRNTLFFLSLWFLRFFVATKRAYAYLTVALSAFLSTENDLHHNLRPNSGGHTSRHNSRVPSEKLNGQGGCF